MRFATVTAAMVIGMTAGMALAQDPAPATTPATEPVVQTESVQSQGSKVLVLAFEQIGGAPAGAYDWIGRAVQQNLVTELGRVHGMTTLAPARGGADPAADLTAAIEAGKQADADVVVFGSYTLNEQDLRFNGQVADVATGERLGTLKSTGTLRDLFAMEDTVATQVKRLLVPEALQPYAPTDTATVDPQTQLQQAQQIQQNLMAQPQVVDPPAAPATYVTHYNQYTYYPRTYPASGYYGYGYYPSYGYRYPGYWGGYYGGRWSVGNFTPWVGVTRTSRGAPYVGAPGTMVARGMISVANYRNVNASK